MLGAGFEAEMESDRGFNEGAGPVLEGERERARSTKSN
jgi:hypothetical protein